MSSEPESPQFPEEWLSDEHLDARVELESGSLSAAALAAGNRGAGAPTNTSRRAAKLVQTRLPQIFLTFRTRRFLTIWGGTRTLRRRQPGPIWRNLLCWRRRVQCSFSLLVGPCRQASQERNTDRMVRDNQATVQKPEEEGIVALVPDVNVGGHWCACIHEHPLCFWAARAPVSAVK